MPRILGRVWKSVWHRRQPLINLFGSLSYLRNLELYRTAYANFSRKCATRRAALGIRDSRLAGGLSQGSPSAGVNRTQVSSATQTLA
jgi:hypothetical protein